MSRDEVLKASESGDHVIIDARAPFRYDWISSGYDGWYDRAYSWGC